MAVSHNNTSFAGRGLSVSSQSWSLTVNSGSNRLLIVGIASTRVLDGRSVSSVTFNGTALTLVSGSPVTAVGAITVEYYYLVNPAVTTANVVVTMSGSCLVLTCGAEVVDGADQSTPFGTPSTATGSSATVSITPSSGSGEMVFGIAGVDNTGFMTLTSTVGTQRWITTASSTQESGASTVDGSTPNLQWSISSSQPWAASAVSIKAAGAGGGAMTGSTSLSVSPSGTVNGAGALLGSTNMMVGPSGTIKGAGSLLGNISMSLASSGALKGSGVLSGSSSLSIAPNGAVNGLGALLGSSNLSIAPTGIVKGFGALQGSISITLICSLQSNEFSYIVGSTALSLAASASMIGSGTLLGNTSISMVPSGTIVGLGALLGSTSASIAATGIMSGSGALRGSTSITLTGSLRITGMQFFHDPTSIRLKVISLTIKQGLEP